MSVRRVGVGVLGAWLTLLACGGVYRRGDDEGASGSSAGGSASGGSPAGGSASSNPSRAGTGSAGAPIMGSAGSPSAAAGTATTMPTPHVPAPCFNDTDCPGSACGEDVCDWTRAHPQPVGDKAFVCTAASARNQGHDGWCTTDANCKCAGLGARCVAPYCSFTMP